MLQPSPSMTFGELCSKQYAVYVSFIFFIPVVAGTKIQYKFRKLHFLRAGSKKGLKPYEAERTIKQKRNLHLTVYSMEVVMLLAFRLNSYQARAVRRELTECISRDHKPFEVVMTAVKGGKK